MYESISSCDGSLGSAVTLPIVVGRHSARRKIALFASSRQSLSRLKSSSSIVTNPHQLLVEVAFAHSLGATRSTDVVLADVHGATEPANRLGDVS